MVAVLCSAVPSAGVAHTAADCGPGALGRALIACAAVQCGMQSVCVSRCTGGAKRRQAALGIAARPTAPIGPQSPMHLGAG